MELAIKRTYTNRNAIISYLHINTKDYRATLFVLENKDYQIPKGDYEIKFTYSPRFDRYLWHLQDVYKRAGIRIHAGNSAEDTRGCLIVGLGYNQENAIVLWSKDAMALLNKCLDKNKTYNLKIT